VTRPDWLDDRSHQLVRHVATASHMVAHAGHMQLEALLGELLAATRLALELAVPDPDEAGRVQLLAALRDYLDVPDRRLQS
jgi:hypothetical protein